ncbi:acyl carrier protein [Streptomyces fenghuangensis]|uniref:Minimal PKS acyl carrier protein n=2 Tax=Streptomyces TaxID=1883 RepID=A0A1I3XMY7_9ACTN|nr:MULTISPECIES: acyl carrier protein [Streptomyces]MBN3932827.1 acyl carrier protein [Streptomyces verrucosisporus]MCG3044098.1 acyl carrier protein [Streptomyces sp. ICN903]MDH2412378.1 acyl carrier protein [Streptomyces chitinivorans]SFK20875.1 minimal PKS acyl carrier protein [Streptomyces pini]
MTDQMTGQVTVEELAALMKQTAGVAVDPGDLRQRAGSGFDAFGLDSLGLLGVVGELEKRYGRDMPERAEQCRTPREFLDFVNGVLTAEA